MNFVIFDLEYTTWDGAQERHWTGENEYKEIIEIGALKVSYPDFEIIDEFNVHIRPLKNPQLSDYCKNLTGITQDIIDQSKSFPEVYKQFLEFCNNCLIMSYGNDMCILAENVLLNKTDPLNLYGKESPSFVNLKFWISQLGKGILNHNSGSLWKNIEHNRKFKHLHEHDALNDCYSILELLIYMHSKNHELPLWRNK